MIETAYLFQAVLILLWWIGLHSSEAFFQAFQFPGIGPEIFSAFLIPDIVIIVALSIVRTYWKSRDLQLIILGAFLYATLFCVNATCATAGGYFPTSIMVLGLGYNFFLSYADRMFRVSATSDFANGIKTVVQIISVWFITLGLIPLLILKTFEAPLIPPVGLHTLSAVLLFVLCSGLGLWSAYVMVIHGKGTPLPLDQAKMLVIEGPYRYVRNPMAIAGLGQGIAVSLVYLSVPIFLYCLLGAIAWQVVVRPVEEQDLLKRFGQGYEEYRKRVRCWIPSFGPSSTPNRKLTGDQE